MKTELTLAERGKPYARYFDHPMAAVPQDIQNLAALGAADPTRALPVQDRDALLRPDQLPMEVGYSIFPDGSAVVAGLTRMPGVNAEMLEWWFCWHGLEGLRYKIWDPEDHYDVYVTPETRARRLNTSLSWKERGWNTVDVATEDIGTGTMAMDIQFMSPEDFGFDIGAFGQGAVTAICANVSAHDGPKHKMLCMSHVAREVPGGVELRSRFWLGWHIVDRRPERVAHIPPEALDALLPGLVRHCPKEYYNLAAILPGLFVEYKDRQDRMEDFQ